MVFGFLTHGFEIPSKKLLALILLFFPSFLWFFLFDQFFRTVIESVTTNLVWIYLGIALFYISMFSFAIVGSMLSEKWRRRRLLEFSIFFGVIATASFAVFQELIFFLFFGVLAGASWGFGFPSSLAFLADSTKVDERARVSGALILITFIMIIFTIGIMTMLQLGLMEYLFIIIILRAISSFALLIDPCERIACKERGGWMNILNTQAFQLYFISWLMFSLAGGIFNLIELPSSIIEQVSESVGIVAQYLGVILSALISGFASDSFGRKKVLIFGLITLGISYALFSIASSPLTFLLTKLVYGSAWGIILVVYSLTVIGDLAHTCSKEKFYAIGVVVPLVVFMVFFTLEGAFSLSISPSLTSSILSMILFLAVIPLLYAPETLPREKIRARKFKKYLKKVKKVVEEEETPNHE